MQTATDNGVRLQKMRRLTGQSDHWCASPQYIHASRVSITDGSVETHVSQLTSPYMLLLQSINQSVTTRNFICNNWTYIGHYKRSLMCSKCYPLKNKLPSTQTRRQSSDWLIEQLNYVSQMCCDLPQQCNDLFAVQFFTQENSKVGCSLGTEITRHLPICVPSVLWHCWLGHLICKTRPWYDL